MKSFICYFVVVASVVSCAAFGADRGTSTVGDSRIFIDGNVGYRLKSRLEGRPPHSCVNVIQRSIELPKHDESTVWTRLYEEPQSAILGNPLPWTVSDGEVSYIATDTKDGIGCGLSHLIAGALPDINRLGHGMELKELKELWPKIVRCGAPPEISYGYMEAVHGVSEMPYHDMASIGNRKFIVVVYWGGQLREYRYNARATIPEENLQELARCEVSIQVPFRIFFHSNHLWIVESSGAVGIKDGETYRKVGEFREISKLTDVQKKSLFVIEDIRQHTVIYGTWDDEKLTPLSYIPSDKDIVSPFVAELHESTQAVVTDLMQCRSSDESHDEIAGD